MTAHEAGHLEFGTFEWPICQTAGPGPGSRTSLWAARFEGSSDIRRCVRAISSARSDSRSLGSRRRCASRVFAACRISWLEPRFGRDRQRCRQVRSLAHGMTVRELVVDQLLLLSTAEAGSVTIPDCRKRVKSINSGRFVRRSSARRRLPRKPCDWPTGSMCAWMNYLPSCGNLSLLRMNRTTQEQSIPAPRSSEDLSDTYRPMDNWDYRGAMDPNLVSDRTESAPEQKIASGHGDSEVGAGLSGDSQGVIGRRDGSFGTDIGGCAGSWPSSAIACRRGPGSGRRGAAVQRTNRSEA